MKKILFLLSLLTLSAILILGCKDPNDPNPKNQTNDDDDNLEQRLALLQGEYKPVEVNKPNYYTSETNIKIENNYFIDDDGRSFEIKTIKELRNEIDSNIITIIDADNYPSDTLCFIEPRWDNIVSLLTKDNSYLLRTRIKPDTVEFYYICYEKIVSGNNPSGETVTLEGQYKIGQANNSTINFDNGNWTFSYNGQTKSGTYSQSGNELTMTFSQNGISATGVFTVTKSGDTITLTGKSGDCVTIISSAFMINDYNALQNQTVTLTVN